MRCIFYVILILIFSVNFLYAQQPQENPQQETQPTDKPQQPQDQQQPQQPTEKPDDKYKVSKPTSVYEVGRIEKGDLITVYYRTGHQRGEQLKPFLEKYLTPQKGYILFNEALHLFAICDTKDNIKLMEQVMNLLDIPSIPIFMSITVYEKTVTSDLEIGLESTYSTTSKRLLFKRFQEAFNPRTYLQSLSGGALPFQGTTISFSTDNLSDVFDFKLRALLERGVAKIHNKPDIVVNSGKKARIDWGEKFYLQSSIVVGQTQTITYAPQEVENFLEITPHVVGKDFLDLELNAMVSQVISFQNIQGVSVPLISKRKASTNITIRDGDKVIIGGLIKDIKTTTVRGVPLLMDIPVIGYLFKSTHDSTEKTEITFVIEAFIVPETGPRSRRLITPEE